MSPSFSQLCLATAILASTTGTYFAITPPNPHTNHTPVPYDSLTTLKLTSHYLANIITISLSVLTLNTVILILYHPTIPRPLPRHSATNNLNPNLITWSSATVIPLTLIFSTAIPLRLVPYRSLGTNFTFALSTPDRLTTSGIYHYVQHPSYTGLVTLVLCNAALLGRLDGTVSCWIPPRYFGLLRRAAWALAPVAVAVLLAVMWMRVKQEERLLRDVFGREWEEWHASTARFVPGIF